MPVRGRVPLDRRDWTGCPEGPASCRSHASCSWIERSIQLIAEPMLPKHVAEPRQALVSTAQWSGARVGRSSRWPPPTPKKEPALGQLGRVGPVCLGPAGAACVKPLGNGDIDRSVCLLDQRDRVAPDDVYLNDHDMAGWGRLAHRSSLLKPHADLPLRACLHFGLQSAGARIPAESFRGGTGLRLDVPTAAANLTDRRYFIDTLLTGR